MIIRAFSMFFSYSSGWSLNRYLGTMTSTSECFKYLYIINRCHCDQHDVLNLSPNLVVDLSSMP